MRAQEVVGELYIRCF